MSPQIDTKNTQIMFNITNNFEPFFKDFYVFRIKDFLRVDTGGSAPICVFMNFSGTIVPES